MGMSGACAALAQGSCLVSRISASEGGAAPPPWEASTAARPDALLEAALAELQAQAAGLEVENARMRLELARPLTGCSANLP